MPEWQEILIAQIVASLKRDYVLKDRINEDFESALRAAFAAQFSNLAAELSDAENINKFELAV